MSLLHRFTLSVGFCLALVPVSRSARAQDGGTADPEIPPTAAELPPTAAEPVAPASEDSKDDQPQGHAAPADTDETPAPARGAANGKSGGAHHAEYGTTLLAGIGRASLTGDARTLGGTAWQWGLEVNRNVTQLCEQLNLTLALDYRYSRHSQNLAAVQERNTSAKATLKRYDLSLLFGLNYAVTAPVSLFTDIGPSVQRRSIFIDADSGGDYDNGFMGGYLWRFGAQAHLDSLASGLVANLFYGMSGGGKMNTGRLKYNGKRMNYNSSERTFGLELGVAL